MVDSPRSTARYVPDRAGFAKYMMSDAVDDLAKSVAREAMAMAIAFSPESAPEDKGSSDGTSYRENFRVAGIVVTLKGAPRRAAQVVNGSAYAAGVEFGIGSWQRIQGGSHGRPSRPLGRTGAILGPLYGDFMGFEA